MPPYQGTLATIRKAVIDRLRLETTPDTPRVNEWINLVYAQVVQETGCFQTCGVTALTADADGYNLAPEVQWVKAVHYTYQDGTISRPLMKVTLDEMLMLRRDDGQSADRAAQSVYTILGQNRIELWPEPGPGAALKFWYVYMPPALVNDTDSPLIKEPYGSKLLETGACVEGAKFKKDPLLQSHQAEYETWLNRFQGWMNRRRSGTGDVFQMDVDTFEYGNTPLVREWT